MRAPTYTPREMEAFAAADRIVARLLVDGQWRETEIFPSTGQTVRSKLAEVQHALRHHLDVGPRRVCLYVGATIRGERMVASVPTDMIPQELRR